MTTPHIIAEAGTNHNGSRATAERLIDVARTAGADSVKFQIIHPEGLYLTRLWQDGSLVANPVVEARRKQMLDDDDYRALADRARTSGIPLSASIFDARGVDLLDSLDPPYLKIASTDLNNGPLLKTAAERGRRMIVSTGMSSLGDIERAVEIITATGNRDLVLMHCVSVYPCPTERMNLGFIDTLRTAFGFPVGLSDHSESSIAAAIAVAKGVSWIEKHFTLDRSSEGFDHAYAMEPDALAAYVADVRAAAAACAPADVKLGEQELTVRKRARRALYAARDLAPGEELTADAVQIVRPEGPLAPNDLPLIVGRRLRRAVRACEPLSIQDFD